MTIKDFPISFKPVLAAVRLSGLDKGHTISEKLQNPKKIEMQRQKKEFSQISGYKGLRSRRERETGKTSFQRIEMRRLIAAFEGGEEKGVKSKKY